jgi:hypothetical protein
VGPGRDEAIGAMVSAWATDVADGKDAAMLAWRHVNVAELNRRARVAMDEAGELAGPELVAPGGRAYRAGDRVVTSPPARAAGSSPASGPPSPPSTRRAPRW